MRYANKTLIFLLIFGMGYSAYAGWGCKTNWKRNTTLNCTKQVKYCVQDRSTGHGPGGQCAEWGWKGENFTLKHLQTKCGYDIEC